MLCPICKSNNYLLIQWGKVKIGYCNSCYLNFSLSKDLSDHYYHSQYQIDIAELFEDNLRRFSLFPEIDRLKKLIKKFIPTGSKVLDFGCSKGYFIDELRREGFHVFGVELNDLAKTYAQSIGLDVKSDLTEFDFKFDAIFMWHSLEHLKDPKETLQQLHNYLEDDGKLFIRVPDFDSFWSKIFKDKWIWFQSKNHISHFSEKSLSKLLINSNFHIILTKKQKPNNWLTFLFFLSNILLHRKKLPLLLTIRKILAKIIEWITGSEIFLIAKRT